MNRPFLVCVLFTLATATLGAQGAGQSSAYEGTSNPPTDDQVVTSDVVNSTEPAAGHRLDVQSGDEAPAQTQPRPSSVDPSVNYPDLSGDDGIVHPTKPAPGKPALAARGYSADPDGDIVHPGVLRPGELGAGTTIRVRLMHGLSTAYSEKGEAFRSRVASDVMQGDKVLIPAGAEIDGKVVDVSTGHAGGYGTMRLRPETVIMADGRRFHLNAELTGTPGSKTHTVGEGTVRPNSRLKRDGMEYGGAVGGGAVTGALVAGPVGALTGSLIGAGVITAHLLISHPQATLENGTALLFTLTEPLYLTRDDEGGY